MPPLEGYFRGSTQQYKISRCGLKTPVQHITSSDNNRSCHSDAAQRTKLKSWLQCAPGTGKLVLVIARLLLLLGCCYQDANTQPGCSLGEQQAAAHKCLTHWHLIRAGHVHAPKCAKCTTHPENTSRTSHAKPSGIDRLKAVCESAKAATNTYTYHSR